MISVYSAKKIYTMNPDQPEATHFAVDKNRIVAVGEYSDVSSFSRQVDERFAEKILMPGFVEAHSHATEGTFWRHTYCGFFDRIDPDGRVWSGLKSVEEILTRLSQQGPKEQRFLTGWGIDPIYFGNTKISRSDLDRVSSKIPTGLVHASCHILNVNSKALELAGLLRRGIVHPGISLDSDGFPSGELKGPEAISLVGVLLGFNNDLLGCDAPGLDQFARLCVRKGVTTASDFANPLQDDVVQEMLEKTGEPEFPIRLVSLLRSRELQGEAMIQRALSLKARSTDRLRLGAVKLVADGSIQGFTARLRSGSYFDGSPNGLWYTSKENILDAYCQGLRYGVQIHTHTNGDQATELAVSCMNEALGQHPKSDHRFVIQHCQLADHELLREMKRLRMCANFFANHIYYWGDQHAAYTLGPDRAAKMNPCASALSQGLPMSIHSDAPITPLDPLFTAWCATNRLTASGRLLGEGERITVAQALYAITMGAAYTLKLDHELGSVEVGKKADIAVLNQDPMQIPGADLRKISIWGTMQSGRIFQVDC